MKAIHRDYAIREVGCVVSRILGLGYVPCEKHHLLTTGQHGNGKRRGEAYTVGLNPYSHRGVPFGGWSLERCREVFGPSYASNAREFRAKYPDDLLLAEQEKLLNEWSMGVIG